MNDRSTLLIDREQGRYEIEMEEERPYIDFKEKDDSIYLTHVQTPPDLRGQGIGAGLVEVVLEHIQNSGKTVVPLCTFAAHYIKRHPEWQTLLKGDLLS